MFVTFIITIRVPFYQIMDYRDTRAYILDPCIQEFIGKRNFCMIRQKQILLAEMKFKTQITYLIDSTDQILAPIQIL